MKRAIALIGLGFLAAVVSMVVMAGLDYYKGRTPTAQEWNGELK